MRKRVFILLISICLVLCTGALAEDYSKYTTEYLLQMRQDITEELERRGYKDQTTDLQSSPNAQIYEDEYIRITLISFQQEDDSVKVRFAFDNHGTKLCTVITNVANDMMTENNAFALLRDIRKIGSGKLFLSIRPGETCEHDYIWPTNSSYDVSVFPYFLPDLQPVVSSVSVEGFPANTVIGITMLLSDNEFDINAQILQRDTNKDFKESVSAIDILCIHAAE